MLELLDQQDKVIFKTTRQKELMAHIMKLMMEDNMSKEDIQALRVRHTAPVVTPLADWMKKD